MQSLLDLFLRLLGGDEELVRAYQADPEGFAQQHFGDLCEADWRDLEHALRQSGLVERGQDGGPGPYANGNNGGDNGGGPGSGPDGGPGGGPGGHGGGWGSSDHNWEDSAHAIAQLHNIVNNFTHVDDRDVINDQSTIQRINTGGGDFWQRIDNDAAIASGDGSVVADDISGPLNTGHIDNSDNSDDTNNTAVVTGDGNIVGDDNDGNVVGDNNVVGNDFSTETIAAGGDLAGGDIDNSTIAAGGDIDTDLAGGDIDNSDDGVSGFNGWFNGNTDSFNDNSVNDSFNDNTDSFNNNAIVGGPPADDGLGGGLDGTGFGVGAAPGAPGFGAFGTDPFDSNYVEGSYNNNTVSDSFNDNALDDSFNNNDVSDSFNNNDLDSSFNSSDLDSSFNDNTVDNSFNDQTVVDDSVATQSAPGFDEALSHNNLPVDVDVTLPPGF